MTSPPKRCSECDSQLYPRQGMPPEALYCPKCDEGMWCAPAPTSGEKCQPATNENQTSSKPTAEPDAVGRKCDCGLTEANCPCYAKGYEVHQISRKYEDAALHRLMDMIGADGNTQYSALPSMLEARFNDRHAAGRAERTKRIKRLILNLSWQTAFESPECALLCSAIMKEIRALDESGEETMKEPDALSYVAWVSKYGISGAGSIYHAARYGDYRYAAGRTEALKPLRDIYARGRLTFRSDGNPDSVEAQEQEFRAAIRAGEET